jgi:hypothetical protein
MKRLSRIQRRLIRSAVEIETAEPGAITYQHTVFCQTGLPYRNPGADVREWGRRQGNIALQVSAGAALHPESGEWVHLPLPFGPKPRLILTHLNREALLRGSPLIEVGDSLTAFVRRLLGFDPNGQEIRAFKDQLGSLTGATVRLAVLRAEGGFQVDTRVISAFDLWFRKDSRQRVLWPETVRLSLDYFDSLQQHAVPLDERAVAALAHSALGLDLYAWLAQRLHRVPSGRPAFVPWTALKEQFGWHYARLDHFRPVFRQTLETVLTQYRGARVELDEGGLTLRHSAPPVKGRLAVTRGG